jgi:hypothetical protein
MVAEITKTYARKKAPSGQHVKLTTLNDAQEMVSLENIILFSCTTLVFSLEESYQRLKFFGAI